MQVVTLFTNFLEDRSPSGKVDTSGSRVAALHYVEDCINRHIRGTVRIDRNARLVYESRIRIAYPQSIAPWMLLEKVLQELSTLLPRTFLDNTLKQTDPFPSESQPLPRSNKDKVEMGGLMTSAYFSQVSPWNWKALVKDLTTHDHKITC